MGSRRELYVEPALPRWWDRFVVVATVASLTVLVIDIGLARASHAARVLAAVDLAFCALFVLDFLLRLRLAPARREFVRRNWVDLLGAVPIVGPLGAAQPFRLLRLVRLARLFVLGKRLLRGWEGLPVTTLHHVAFVAAGFWLTAGFAFFAFEHGHNTNIEGVDDALWWSMTTLSTVGYGDTYPATEGGRLVAILTMVFGVGVLATLAGGIATLLTELRDRGRRGMRRPHVRNHLLVLGWNDDAHAAVADFRADPRYTDTDIVVVTDRESAPCEGPGVHFVRGVPTRSDSLERAGAKDAAAVILVPEDANDPRSDHASALAAMAVRRLSPNVPMSAALVTPENRELLEQAGCSAIVDRATITSLMLVRTVQDLGVAEVLEDLIRNDGGSELHRMPIEPAFVGQTFGAFAKAMVDRSCAVVALARAGAEGGLGRGEERYLVNPAPELVLRAGDEVLVVSAR